MTSRPRAFVHLDEIEARELDVARGVLLRATYCRQAALWLADLIVDYLLDHDAAIVAATLPKLLYHYRPDRSRHSRGFFTDVQVNVRPEDRAKVDQARLALGDGDGVLDLSTFYYLGLHLYLDQQRSSRTSFADLLDRYSR